VLVSPDELLERLLVLRLGAPDQFAVIGCLGGTPLGYRLSGGPRGC
jgi:hypothetical protein